MVLMHVLSLLFLSSISWVSASTTYTVSIIDKPATPILSFIDGTSDYEQVFNPSFVESSPNNPLKGLLVRTQNCSLTVNGSCGNCGGTNEKASSLTFSIKSSDNSFSPITSSSLVFTPSNLDEACGTEDPRIKYNPIDGVYYLFYTAWNCIAPYLHLASTINPTLNSNWTRHGPVFPLVPGSKSAAMLIKPSDRSWPFLYYLIWGDSDIRITGSNSPINWTQSESKLFLQPRDDMFDSGLVESGPPPLLLSTGDYIFFYNSATKGFPGTDGSGYHAGYLILSGEDPTEILLRSNEPLLSPDTTWAQGVSPYTCNVPRVVFLEGAEAVEGEKDTFIVYFGGADAVVGQATVKVTVN